MQKRQRQSKSKRQNRISGLLAITLIGASLVTISCTKEIPYKYQTKEDVFDKPDTNAEYIYSSSMQNASMTSSDALPFSSGDNKRVKFRMTKGALQVVEVERDARFQENKANDKLVLEIPVDNIDYQCAKDKYGECTNTEEENKDLDWSQKSKIKIKLGEVKSGELDLLPIMESQTVGDNCYEPVTSRLLSYEFTKEAVNFQIERTFKTKLECLTSLDKISDATVSAVYHYSMVRTDQVLSSDFKPIDYPEDDQNTFGYFTTQRTPLSKDNNKYQSQKVSLMNHWNPNRSDIQYYLSDEFAKPENKTIKDLTYKTVDAINDGLVKAGVKFRIKLNEPAGKIPGDIRNSMIVLVEDPVASSVIGYGPQTEDPVTGEIISARTVMFLGTIKKYIQVTYDDVIKAKKEKLAKLNLKSTSVETSSTTLPNSPVGEPPVDIKTRHADVAFSKLAIESRDSLHKNSAIRKSIKDVLKNMSTQAQKTNNSSSPLMSSSIKEMTNFVKNYTQFRNSNYDITDLKSKLRYMNEVKNCAYFPNFDFASEGGISQRLTSKFSDDAKFWKDLSEEERQNAIDIILPEIWIPTLIHEMGHNLGLRHNFEGSEDKDNFYSQAELQAFGIDHEIPFSTVMEYGDDLKALPVMGKYDIAALKFGYRRVIDKMVLKSDKSISADCFKADDDGESKKLLSQCLDIEEVSVSNTLAETKKIVQDLYKNKSKESNSKELADAYSYLSNKAIVDYKYCTDEHTGINAGCRRFDLGTSLSEIIDNEIKSYKEAYDRRNRRNDRENFSLTSDVTYASRVREIFSGMRIMLEIVERLQLRFGINPEDPELMMNPFFQDLFKATTKAGDFLLEVIKTPELTCAVSTKQGIQLAPARAFNVNSCNEVRLREGFKMVGELGRVFNSVKDSNSPNHYADQIDVRGYWIDKAMAIDMLFNRKLRNSSLDQGDFNFLDFPFTKEEVLMTAVDLLSDKMTSEVNVKFYDGSPDNKLELVTANLYEANKIEKHIYPSIGKVLGLPDRESYLQERLINKLKNEVVNGSVDRSFSSAPIANLFKVELIKQVNDNRGATPAGYVKFDNGDDRFYINTKTNTFAYSIFEKIQALRILPKSGKDKIQGIIKIKEQEEAPKKEGDPAFVLPNLSADEKIIYAFNIDTLQDFLDGTLSSPEQYVKILYLLAQ